MRDWTVEQTTMVWGPAHRVLSSWRSVTRCARDVAGCFLLALFATAFSTKLPAQSQRWLVVEVVSAERIPLEGVHLSLYDVGGAPIGQLRSGQAGEVRFTLPNAGALRVQARRIGFIARDTVVTPTLAGETRVRLQLESVRTVLATRVVEEDLRCPTGYGRLRESNSLAQVLLSTVDATLNDRTNSTADSLWLTTIVQRRVSERGDTVQVDSLREWSENAPSLVQVPDDSLDALGYVWMTRDEVQFALPHPRTLASVRFLDRHCFRRDVAEVVAADQAVGALEFVPTLDRQPAQLAGRLLFGGLPTRLQRMEFHYVRTPSPVRDSMASADIEVVTDSLGRTRIQGWRQSLPIFGTSTRMYPGASRWLSFGDLRAQGQLEYEVQFERHPATPAARQQIVATSALGVATGCDRLTPMECLESANARWNDGTPQARIVAVAQWQEVCSSGPWTQQLLVDRVNLADTAALLAPSRVAPSRELSRALFRRSNAALGQPEIREEMDGQRQAEACMRVLDAHARLGAIGGDGDAYRGAAALRLCQLGEGAACLLAAAVPSASTRSVVDSTVGAVGTAREWALLRGCVLGAQLACSEFIGSGSTAVTVADRLQTFARAANRRDIERMVSARLRAIRESSHSGFTASLPPRERVEAAFAAFPRVSVAVEGQRLRVTITDDNPRRGESDPFGIAGQQAADSLAVLLLEDASLRAEVQFHTDSGWGRGSLPGGRDVTLSIARGEAATRQRAWLQRLGAQGIPTRQYRLSSRIWDDPVFAQTTAFGRQMNRRVEIVLWRDVPERAPVEQPAHDAGRSGSALAPSAAEHLPISQRLGQARRSDQHVQPQQVAARLKPPVILTLAILGLEDLHH